MDLVIIKLEHSKVKHGDFITPLLVLHTRHVYTNRSITRNPRKRASHAVSVCVSECVSHVCVCVCEKERAERECVRERESVCV